MRKSLYFLLLLCVVALVKRVEAQSIRDQVGPKLLKDSSTVERLKRVEDSLALQNKQRIEIRTGSNESLIRLLKEQEDRRKKQKRLAYLRIGIGIVLLAVLIVGMRRRRVKKV